MRPARALRAAFLGTTLMASCAPRSHSATGAAPTRDEHAVVALAVTDDARFPAPPAPPAPSAPRRVGACDDPGAPVHHFTVAHLNDMQARYSERIEGRSRYAYVAGYLRALKEEVPATLVLDAGDDYEKGVIAELRSMGESTRQMIQALPIDVRTIGNHDFAYGEAALLRDVRASAHPVLAANVARADGTSPFLPYVELEVGCVKIGVAGLVTQSYGADDQPSKEPFDGVFVQSDRYADALERVVRAHRADVDVMIALDHLGLFEDASLAMKVSGVDLVVGGHSEDLVKEPRPAFRPDGTRAWVAQAGHFARTIGRVDFAYAPREKKLAIERARMVDVDARLPCAGDVAELAERLEREYAPEAHAPIAFARARVTQSGMTDLVWRAARETWGVDAMLVGRDLYWEGLPEGPITLQRLYDSVLVQREPAGTSGFSSLFVVELTGAELLALEASASGGGTFALFAPAPVARARTYRLAIEKRALTYPKLALRGAAPAAFERARYAGEMIDVLEAFARDRTRRGLALDE